MKHLKLFVLLSLFAFMMTECTKESDLGTLTKENSPKIDLSTDFKVAMNSGSSNRYILQSTGLNENLSTIRGRLASLGAMETGYLPELDALFVSSDHGNFVDEMKKAGLVVVRDLIVEVPNVNAEPMKPGGDNPPSAGDDDEFFDLQWGMDAIDAPQAWNEGFRGAGVRVAVLDGGWQPQHPDLAPNIDFAARQNFVNLDDVCEDCCVFGECDPLDINDADGGFSHATHVAGIIAAVDNEIGVIGTAPDAEIVPVKVLSDLAGFGYVSWIAAGIVYASHQNVQVINMSLGGLRLKGVGKGSNVVQAGIKLYNDAIKYANDQGVTVITAAGNNGINFNHAGSLTAFPAGSPYSIAISATSPYGWAYDVNVDLDELASYSNHGNLIDFAAPGGDFDHPGALYFFDMVLSTSGPSGYWFAAGTSMASPHAAGVAALIIEKNGGMMKPNAVEAALRHSVEDLGKPGRDVEYGRGRINAHHAVR